MIKSLLIIVFFASGHLCRVIPDEVPIEDNTEERTVNEQTESSNDESKTDVSQDSENARTLSIDERSEEKTASVDQAEEDDKKADLEEKSLKTRSADEVMTVKSASNENSATTPEIDETPKTASSEKSGLTTKITIDDEKVLKDDILQMLRNLGENVNSGANQAKSFEQDNATEHLRSGAIETNVSNKDDAAHIQIKEQRNASEDDESGQESEIKEDSKSASPENYSNIPSDGELKSFDEVSAEKTASLEDSRIVYDADHENSRSADAESEDLIRAATDLVEPVFTATRRMLGDVLNVEDDKSERSDSNEAGATRMSGAMVVPPEEDSSEHQVHSNYIGGSRFIQSQYPYTPLESKSASPLLSLPFPNELPSAHKFPSLPPIPSQNEHSYFPSQNLENGFNFKQFRQFPKLELPQLPSLPLESNGRFDFPPLDHRFQHHRPQSSWKPECNNCNTFQNYQQPFQRFQRLIPADLKPLQNMVPMLRHASDESQQSPGSFSRSWSSFQESPLTYSSSVNSWRGTDLSRRT